MQMNACHSCLVLSCLGLLVALTLNAAWQGERCYTYTTAVRRYLGEPCWPFAEGIFGLTATLDPTYGNVHSPTHSLTAGRSSDITPWLSPVNMCCRP